MKAYIINLARAADRRAHMERQLPHAGLDGEFIDAVDGRDLDLCTPGLVGSRWLGSSPFSPNVVACALSHQMAYRRVVEGSDPGAVILEDDVELPSNLGSLTERLAERIVGAHVVLLNYHSARRLRLSRKFSLALSAQYLAAQPSETALLGSAGCYFITKESAGRMTELAVPVIGAADEWGHYFDAGAFDLLWCVTPMPVRKSADFRSTIGYRRKYVRQLGDMMESVVWWQGLLRARRRRLIERWAQVELTDDCPYRPGSV